MSKRCAYCDQPGKLTREHVWPKCFMEREGHEAAHFSVVTQSVHKADYVVKDVLRAAWTATSVRFGGRSIYGC